MKKKMMKQVMAMSVICTLAGTGVACGNTAEMTETTTESLVETTTESSVEESTSEVSESVDETLKVVSMGPNITEILYSVDAGGMVVGRTDYCDFPAEVLEVESVGGLREPNIEKIIELQPDVVIASTHFEDEVGEKLEDAGITVEVLYEETEVEGVYTMIESIGDLVGKEEQASQVVADMQAAIDETTQAIEGLDPVSVYYVVGFGEFGDYTAGGDTFIHDMLTVAGGENVAADVEGWNYTLEALIEKDPEYIIIRAGDKETFMSDANYANLTAVKEDRVFEIDNNLLDRQGVRNAEGIQVIAEILHAEAFQ